MVWELDGPMPILNMSKTLTVAALKRTLARFQAANTKRTARTAVLRADTLIERWGQFRNVLEACQ